MRAVCRSAGLKLACVLAFALAIAVPSAAAPITISLNSHGLALSDPLDVVVAGVVAGPEVAKGDGSAIGDDVMFDGEFIDIGASSITFSLFGGGSLLPNPLYRDLGFDPAAYYVISGLYAGFFEIASIGAPVLTNVTGVALGSEVFLDGPNTIRFLIGTLGVLETPENLGTVTLNFSLRQVDPGPGPDVVPEPGTWLLIGSGVVALFVRRKRLHRN